MKKQYEIEPITFSITDPKDLQMLQKFKNEYQKCRRQYPDVTGALFAYEVIPTGLGLAWTVKCSCGERISLYGDIS